MITALIVTGLIAVISLILWCIVVAAERHRDIFDDDDWRDYVGMMRENEDEVSKENKMRNLE